MASKDGKRTRTTAQEKGGAFRRQALGLVYIQVELTPAEKKAIKHAAIDADESVAGLVRRLICKHVGLPEPVEN